MFPIGLSTSGTMPLTEEMFQQMAQSGVAAMELSYRNFDGFDYQKVKGLANRHGIRLWSMHLPFSPFSKLNPASPDPEIQKYTMALFQELIGRGTEIGIDKFVVHPSGEPNVPETREEGIKHAMEFLDALAEYAHGKGAQIAVENLPRTCLGNTSAELERIIGVNDKLRVCFDLNHSLIEDNSAYIQRLGSKIITLHVSDYNFIDECHFLPGEGKVDWIRMVELLKEAGYQGMWMYELGFEPTKKIDRRWLIAQDFVDNARTIFAGKIPAPIGKPFV